EPLDGGLAGLIKTAAQEWPEVACKAFDRPDEINLDHLADDLVEELFFAGPIEVGLTPAGRVTLERIAEPAAPALAPPFGSGEVIVLSGGARGVTAEVAVALAAAFRPTLLLLGRSPLPGSEPDWLAGLTAEADIKRALGQRGHSVREAGAEHARIV